MLLGEIIKNLYDGPIDETVHNKEISSICCDSRKAQKDSLFVALKGIKQNGNDFILDAIDKGANTIVTAQNEKNLNIDKSISHLIVDDPAQFLRQIALRFFANPSQHIRMIGITGTNGKTTIAYLIESILHEAEKSCSVVGTVNYRIGEKILPAINTTPGYLDNQRLLSEMVEDGVEYCIMEVSSHALDQGRTDQIDFKTAVFTNLTSDHLDYHKTRQNYFEAKAKLFSGLSSDSLSVINVDDDYGRKLFSRTNSNIFTYGIERNADLMARDIELDIKGTKFKMISPDGEIIVRTPLVGDYNVYNILASAAVALNEGISLDKIKKGVENLQLVPGRLETVDCQEDFTVIIDYAHTQDALQNVLNAIRLTSDAKIILVFGCGGDRDKTKRPEMGYVASQLADHVIITSDNPRGENPEIIIEEIVTGFEGDHHRVVVDRKEAIKMALNIAQKGDIILITGKGHEDYQVFKDRTVKFDERQIIRQSLRC